MDISRRSFIKWVIAGAASASPFGCAPQGKGKPAGPFAANLSSETVIILGVGPSGLAATERCFGSDFLLFEKEPHVGGNAWSEPWNGLNYLSHSDNSGAVSDMHEAALGSTLTAQQALTHI